MALEPTTDGSADPFNTLIGLDITQVSAERCVATIEVQDRHCQPYGIVHGGVYCAMAETVASMGGATAAVEGGSSRGAVGQSNHTDFLRATRVGATITAVATPSHVGRSVQLWQVEIRDQDDRLVATSKVRLFNID